MTTFVLSFLVVALAVAGLSVGVLLGREPIKGSCGGAGAGCGACARPCRRRRADEDDDSANGVA